MVVRTSVSGEGRHAASGTRPRPPERPSGSCSWCWAPAASSAQAPGGPAATRSGSPDGRPGASGWPDQRVRRRPAERDLLPFARGLASPQARSGTFPAGDARGRGGSPRSVRAAAASYLSGRAGTVLAAVYDLRTGRTWHLGQGRPQAEASVVKLDVLETLLAERGQGDGTGLSASERALAEQMIEDSDNDAATSLWYAAGGAAGIRSFNATAGLTRHRAVVVRGLSRVRLAGLGADHDHPGRPDRPAQAAGHAQFAAHRAPPASTRCR